MSEQVETERTAVTVRGKGKIPADGLKRMSAVEISFAIAKYMRDAVDHGEKVNREDIEAFYGTALDLLDEADAMSGKSRLERDLARSVAANDAVTRFVRTKPANDNGAGREVR